MRSATSQGAFFIKMQIYIYKIYLKHPFFSIFYFLSILKKLNLGEID